MTLPLILLVMHFVGDFLLQSDWMALNKSKHWDALTVHVTIYALCFLPWGWRFWAVTYVTHWATDFVTSRATSKLWFIDSMPIAPGTDVPTEYGTVFGATHYARLEAWKRHWFFIVIGVDQLIHAATLAITWHAVGLG